MDLEEDEKGSDASSFVMHDFFVSDEQSFFVAFLWVQSLFISGALLEFLESCKHASCIPVTSSISTNFMNNVLSIVVIGNTRIRVND